MFRSLKDGYILFKKAVNHFSKNTPLLLASSTAFFATFSLAPILLIITTLFGFFINDKLIREEIMSKINLLFGSGTARTIGRILENIRGLTENWYISVMGFIFLIFVGTTLLIIVQTSLNQLWGVKQKPEKQVVRIIKDRLISFLIILITGILILASFLSKAVLAFIRVYLQKYLPDLNLALLEAINEIVAFIIVVVWFAIIYKFLPAVKIAWRAVWIGSLVTSGLFTIGRIILVKLLQGSNISSVYGASGSIILILLFVFYSALIFYMGAAFTRVYADYSGYKIVPKSYAVRVKIVEEEN